MENALTQADKLVELITNSVAQIKEVYSYSKQTLPVLDDPDASTAPMSPDFRASLRILQGACSQLTALLTPPAETIITVCSANFQAFCLDIISLIFLTLTSSPGV